VMWTTYIFEARAHRLTGGFPANPRLIEAWLSKNQAPEEAYAAAGEQLAVIEAIEPEETHATTFWRDGEGRPTYESRALKAAIKEAANILGSSAKRSGLVDTVNLRSKIAERVFVDPRVGGYPIVCGCGEEHGTGLLHITERPIQVMTMRGPRTSLKRVEMAFEVPLKFSIRVLDDGMIGKAELDLIFEYLQDAGLGADRSQGSGTYDLLRFEAA
jgi:hypothetical protein